MRTVLVGKLIEALQKYDDSTPVYMYNDTTEDGANVVSIQLMDANQGDEFPYCKGDPPEELPEKYVLLFGRL